MPTVPTYDAFQVAPRVLPSARQSTESSIASPALFDARARQTIQSGSQLLKGGTALNDVAVNMQERENADMLFRAETGLKDDYLKFENGVRQRRGQNAWGATQDATKWWDDAVKTHSETLTNDVQRELFTHQAAKLRTQSLDTISAYEGNQRRKSLVDSAQASIVGSINLAAANPEDPQALAGAKTDIVKHMQVMADINGWPPALRAAKLSQYLTDFHKGVIQSLVDQHPQQAAAYFAANKAEIAGADQAGIEKTIHQGTLRSTAQSFADSAMGLGEAGALAEARKRFSGDAETAAVQEVRSRFAEADAARQHSERDAADQAWKSFAQNGSLDKVPAATLAQMDGRSLLALRKEASAKARGTPVQTDWGAYYDLRQMAASDPQKFEQLDLRNDFDKLGPAQRHELIDAQQKMKDPVEVKDVATLTQQLDAVHNQLGWSASDREKKGKFDAEAMGEINAAQQRLGHKLDFDQRQKIIDRLTIQGKVDNPYWFDSTERVFQLTPGEMSRFTPNIPQSERAEIEGALTRAKLPVTDAHVMRLYKKAHGLP